MKKVCNSCNEEKTLDDFRRDKNRIDGRRSSCKICDRSRQMSLWHERYSEKYKERRQAARDDRRQLINEAKTCGCIFCGEKEPVCLDFHHVNEEEKDYGVSAMLTFSRERILEEIAKCIVVCANCHRKIHAGLLQR